MIMHLWQDKTGPPMSATHFGFGVSALVAPQLARNILSTDAVDKSDDSVSTMPANITYMVDDGGEIEIPYAVVASLALLISIFLLIFYLKGPPTGFPERKRVKLSTGTLVKMISPSSCSNGDTFFGMVLFVLFFLYFIQASGGEGLMGELISQ